MEGKITSFFGAVCPLCFFYRLCGVGNLLQLVFLVPANWQHLNYEFSCSVLPLLFCSADIYEWVRGWQEGRASTVWSLCAGLNPPSAPQSHSVVAVLFLWTLWLFLFVHVRDWTQALHVQSKPSVIKLQPRCLCSVFNKWINIPKL